MTIEEKEKLQKDLNGLISRSSLTDVIEQLSNVCFYRQEWCEKEYGKSDILGKRWGKVGKRLRNFEIP